MTTDDELRKLIALGEKATARPWGRGNFFDLAIMQTDKDSDGYGVAFCYPWGEPTDRLPANAIQKRERDCAYITAAANLAPAIARELIEAREEIQRLRVALESLRITSHTECEDCWYSCPKSDDYCGTDDREHCACGMDKQNAIIDAALNGGDL